MSDDINLDSGFQWQQNQRIRYPVKRDFIHPTMDLGAGEAINLRPQQGAVNPSHPSPPNKEAFEEAIRWYKLGVDGDKQAVHKSYDLLKRILQTTPENPQVEAYLGCVTSLLGRDAEDAGERFKYALDGLKLLDKVVTNEPENIEFRGLRAFVCQKLPEMYFHRSKTAIEDFSYLVSRYEQNQDVFAKDYFHQVLFELGAAYNRLGQTKEAENIWSKLLSLTNDDKYQKLLKAEGYQPKAAVQQPTSYQYTPPVNYDYLMKEGVALYSRALANDSKALEKGLKLFQRAHKANPEDPLIAAYYADLLSLSGKDSPETSTMIGNAMKAIKILDQAVNASPDNITITLLRANHSFRLPEAFFRRTLTAVNDYNFLVEKYEKDPSILPEETYWQILYNLGTSYQRLDMNEEAKEVWLKLAPNNNSKYREAILAQLDDFSSESLEVSVDNLEELLQEGIRLHNLAVSGNTKASIKAKELLQKVYQADPTNALAEGYYGSSIALAGRDSTDSKGMYAGAHQGLAYLNKAIEHDSNNYRLRLLRAYFLNNLPKRFFSTFDDPIKDFRFLKMAYEKDPSIFSRELYGKVVYDLGICYERAGQTEKAQKIWNGLLKKGFTTNGQELSQDEEEKEIEAETKPDE